MKSTWANSENCVQKWFVVDAENKILGRLASKVAQILMGKTKPVYTPFIDAGDFVVIVNAEKIGVTGRKMNDKVYNWHTGYFGGLKTRTLAQMLDKKPEDVIKLAVKRMLPKTRMGRQMIKKLKIYTGAEHPHAAQQPVNLDI